MSCTPSLLRVFKSRAHLCRFVLLTALWSGLSSFAGAQSAPPAEPDAALAAATVTVDRERLTLADVIALCERQTNYRFVYVQSELPLTAEIAVTPGRGIPLAKLLDTVHRQTGVTFRRTGNQIAARAPRTSGTGTLGGRVQDANTGSYLLGATVTLRELGRSAVTGRDGTYFFADVPAGTYTIAADFIGYKPATETVAVISSAKTLRDLSVGAEVLDLGKFVVEGNREGLARALQQKRTSDAIEDIVSADSAGKLPDGNAAEAVRRLPGVFAEIDQNEGRYIVVRGIDASLNNVTINGITVGSPEGGSRAVAMDAVPADLIDRIEVVKAVTPDMDAQAVGASVNIVTPSAFDHAEPFAYGTLAGGYFNGPRHEFKRNSFTPYSGSASYGTTFGDGKWGVVVGGSFSYRHYISNRRSGGGEWYPAAADGEGANIFFPAEQSLFHYDVQRWREGLNAALEFRPTDRHRYFLRVSDNHFRDDEGRNLNGFEFFRTNYPASFTPTSAHFTGGRNSVEYRHYLQEHNITNYSFGGKDSLGDGSTTLDYTVAIGDANIEVPDREDWEFRSAAKIVSDIDTSTLYWKVTPDPVSKYYDPATYPFRRVRFRQDSQTEDNYNLIANLKREQRILGHDGFWQIGGRYFSHKKAWDRRNNDFLAGTGANAFNLSQFGVAEAAPEVFDGDFAMTPQIDLAAMRDFFVKNPQYFVPYAAGSFANSYADDLQLEENVAAAYAMSRVNFGAWSLLAGLRMENTDADVMQTELPTQGSTSLAPRLNHFSKRYTNVLPGVHLRYEARKNWVWRAAWTNTIGRPNYVDMAATSEFSYIETEPGSGIYTGGISSGNADLQPYESMNFDLTSEYYFQSTGILSMSAFHKRIDNPVFTNAYTLRNTTYAGMNFESLSYSRPENADLGKITGVELAYQQQLTMLPSPFDGLGFSVNFTYADSDETMFSRPGETLPFAKQAEKIGNVALFYEKYRVQFRLAYTHTGAFIKSFGSSVNSDSYQSARDIIDAKISYRINRHLSVFADVINLGEEPLDEYARQPGWNSATESYWWTANFGINWRL